MTLLAIITLKKVPILQWRQLRIWNIAFNIISWMLYGQIYIKKKILTTIIIIRGILIIGGQSAELEKTAKELVYRYAELHRFRQASQATLASYVGLFRDSYPTFYTVIDDSNVLLICTMLHRKKLTCAIQGKNRCIKKGE